MMCPGLSVSTRIFRGARSVVQVRANERIAAFVAEVTENEGIPSDAAIESSIFATQVVLPRLERDGPPDRHLVARRGCRAGVSPRARDAEVAERPHRPQGGHGWPRARWKMGLPKTAP